MYSVILFGIMVCQTILTFVAFAKSKDIETLDRTIMEIWLPIIAILNWIMDSSETKGNKKGKV